MKKHWSLKYSTFALTIIPLLIFAALTLYISYSSFSNTMYLQIETELENNAANLRAIYDSVYPGDYVLKSENPYTLLKGDKDITKEYRLIDEFKDNTDSDATIFYGNERLLTTILDSDGERIVGTKSQDKIAADVLATGNAHFYHGAIVNGEPYFSYYLPLINSDGSVVGMIFVGKPTHGVETAVHETIRPIIIAILMLTLCIALLTFLFTNDFTGILMHIHSFLAEIAGGSLYAKIDESVIKRTDELGDIGRSAVTMQESILNLINQDPLTEIYNRRYANKRLKEKIKMSEGTQDVFCVAIADIDHFKTINDTYGHDAGDTVLCTIANMMADHMNSKGFAARWGGEEFLLVFEKMDLLAAEVSLGELLYKIRSASIIYDFTQIRVTVTFGVTEYKNQSINELVKSADMNLYYGKSSGRNKVVAL